MAKDRDGSINIYGSLQAKTEDGYVAYTDGIAHENEDGTKTPLDQLLKDSGGIIDVESLPQIGWIGTAVSADGTAILDEEGNPIGVEGGTVVEKLYFNTELTIEETNNILDKITNWFDGSGTGEKFLSMLFFDGNNIFQVMKLSNFYTILSATMGGEPTYLYASSEEMGLGFSGWNQDVTYPIEINSSSAKEAMGLPIGQENDKLTSLFSTTPFVYEQGNINDKSIYRLKEGGKSHIICDGVMSDDGQSIASGTVIPNLNFNTSLSIEEVHTELDKITSWVQDGETSFSYFLLFTPIIGVMVGKDTSSGSNDYIITDLYGTTYFDSTNGWNTEITYPIEINSPSITVFDGMPIGTDNDKIVNLMYTGGEIKYTYWVYKDKWVQLIDNRQLEEVIVNFENEIEQTKNLINDFESIITIEKNIAFSLEGGSFSSYLVLSTEEIEIFKNKNNAILKINYLVDDVINTTYLGTKCKLDNEILMFEFNTGTSDVGCIYISFSLSKGSVTETKIIKPNGTEISNFQLQYNNSDTDENVYLKLLFKDKYGSSNQLVQLVKNKEVTDSFNLVTSRAVYTSLATKQNKITVTENDDGTVDITIPTE